MMWSSEPDTRGAGPDCLSARTGDQLRGDRCILGDREDIGDVCRVRRWPLAADIGRQTVLGCGIALVDCTFRRTCQ